MSVNAGQLLVVRQNVTVPQYNPETGQFGNIDVDTGLCQENRSYENGSVNEPIDGAPGNQDAGLGPVVVPDPAIPSRVQVIPESPLGEWATITHGEPYFNTITQTVHVLFHNGVILAEPAHTINVCFWMPHSAVGPVECDLYTPIT